MTNNSKKNGGAAQRPASQRPAIQRPAVRRNQARAREAMALALQFREQTNARQRQLANEIMRLVPVLLNEAGPRRRPKKRNVLKKTGGGIGKYCGGRFGRQ
jgi:hypothetical protein